MMKLKLFCLGLFLLAGALTLCLAFIPPPRPARIHSEGNGVVTNTRVKIVKEGLKEKVAIVAAPEAQAFDWASVEAQEYRQYIANLRGIECPEETIRDIILADVNKLFAPREAPFKKATEALLPWESVAITVASSSNSTEERRRAFEQRKQLREIEKEKAALLKELLGIDLPLTPLRSWGSRNFEVYEVAFNALPPSKRESVRDIQENYWQVSDGLNDKYNLQRTPEYLEEYKRLNVERRALLAKVLSPEEIENYDLRTSGIASSMSSQLADFKPSEAEFRDIYKIRQAIEEPYGGTLTVQDVEVDNNNERAYLERQKQIDEKVKALLGEDRFAEYQRAQDWNYRRLTSIGERHGVPRETVLKAYEIQQSFQQEMQKMQSNPGVAGKDRNTAFQTMQQSNMKAMQDLLGERAFRSFNRGGMSYRYGLQP